MITNFDPDEEWLEVPYPYDRYLMSTHGRLLRVDTGFVPPLRMISDRRQELCPGYRIKSDNQVRNKLGSTTVLLPVLMWRTFVGPLMAGQLVDRFDPEGPWHLDNLALFNPMTHQLLRKVS